MIKNTKTRVLMMSLGPLFALGYAAPSLAHGSFETPVSRVYRCYLEGPENPTSDACRETVNIGGTQPLYDWNEVSQGEAGGNHMPLVPDGTLCAGGRDKYRGLNQARDDWKRTPITLNDADEIEFVYYATAPHSTEYFRFYVTKDSYDLNTPLTWNDLDPVFCEINNISLDSDQRYRMSCPAPQDKSGKHIIYNIWQRDDSPEAFYACIDVDFSGDSATDLIFMDGFEQQ